MKNVIKKRNKVLINTYKSFKLLFYKNIKFLKKKKFFFFFRYQNKLSTFKTRELFYTIKFKKVSISSNYIQKKNFFNFINLSLSKQNTVQKNKFIN